VNKTIKLIKIKTNKMLETVKSSSEIENDPLAVVKPLKTYCNKRKLRQIAEEKSVTPNVLQTPVNGSVAGESVAEEELE
jgi:hypothetical protein